MDTTDDEKQYISLTDVCALLNRDPVHINEFLQDSGIELETVDGEVCMDVQALLEHITDIALEMSDQDNEISESD